MKTNNTVDRIRSKPAEIVNKDKFTFQFII